MKRRIDTKDWQDQVLWAFFILFPIISVTIGAYIFGNVIVSGLIGLSSGLLFGAWIFFGINKKLVKDGCNPVHSRRAGWFSIFCFILFWIIGLFVIFEKRINQDIIGIFHVFVILPLAVLLFYSAAILIIYFGIVSLISGRSIIRLGIGVKKVTGSVAVLSAIVYILIGLSFLFILLAITYEVGICPQFRSYEGTVDEFIF